MHSVAIRSRLLAEVRDIYLLQSIQTGSGAHPGPISSSVKQLGHEADNSPASSAEVKEVELRVDLSLKCLHGMHRDNFTLDSYLSHYHHFHVLHLETAEC
jgi:hypothetical protein